MNTRYYLQKIPVEAVQPGYSLAIRDHGEYRLFKVERAQTSQRSGQPMTVTLTAGSGTARRPWVLNYEAGTPVVRLFGVCQAAAS